MTHILLKKIEKASVQTDIKEICIAGGVSANSGLRKTIQDAGKKIIGKYIFQNLDTAQTMLL